MDKITEYKVLSALYTQADASDQHDRLTKKVNEHIQVGWQPYGPLGKTILSDTLILTQPMVRYDT